MKNFFKPKDFKSKLQGKEINWDTAWREIADIANEKFQKLIDSWPEVYAHTQDMDVKLCLFGQLQNPNMRTHKARLAFIEELPKEPCKHEPDGSPSYANTKCCKCGVELVAEWKAK